MLQKRKEEEKVNRNKAIQEEFKALKEKKVEKATTRTINFKIKIGCGCGGNYKKYHAEVPIDSPLHDKMVLNDFKDEMSNIREGWL